MQFKIRHVQTCRWHGLVGRKRSVGEALDAQKNQRKNATFSSSGSKQIQLCMAIQSSAISFIASFFNQFAPRLSVQCHLYCGYKMLVLCLQGFCSVATRCLQRGYKMLVAWLQDACSVATKLLQRGSKMLAVWQQGICSVAARLLQCGNKYGCSEPSASGGSARWQQKSERGFSFLLPFPCFLEELSPTLPM